MGDAEALGAPGTAPGVDLESGEKRSRLRNVVLPIVAALLLVAGLLVVHHELGRYRLSDIQNSLGALPWESVLAALALTACSYFVLTGYDLLALRYLRRELPYRKVAAASFVGYVFSYNVGLSILGGSATRYRLYSSWGLSVLEIAKVIAFCALTFWIGVFTTAGLSFTLEPLPIPPALHAPFETVRPLGLLFLFTVSAYLVAAAVRREPLRVGRLELALPSFRFALLQIAVATADWLVASSVLYVLLPSSAGLSYTHFLGIYLLANMAGVLSHIPGGLGVIETVMLFFLTPAASAPDVLASLLVYRGIYYLLPLLAATLVLGGNEIAVHRKKLGAVVESLDWVPRLIPSVYGLAVFASGVLLLFSGATPAEAERLRWLRQISPLPVIEVSHFLGSLVGAALLVVGRSLQQRIDAAYYATVTLLAVGITASLLKGLDFEEAALLALVLAALLPAHEQFYRPASLWTGRFSLRWTLAVLLALAATAWLLLFSFKHVELTGQTFWTVAFRAEAPRSLRATVGGAALGFIFLTVRFFRPGQPKLPPTEVATLERVRAVVAASPETRANLALLGDKRFLLAEEEDAFLMYGVKDRSWVSMGDPVGPENRRRALCWRFREMADRAGGWPVFYEIGPKGLPVYLELGLTLLKLGEEGRVELSRFTLEGGAKRGLRAIQHRHLREGSRFGILSIAEVEATLPRLREISDAWLQHKKTREKGFSLGAFSEGYVRQFPAATVWRGEELVAFANLWAGAERHEVSIDLMRFHPELAPPGVMEFLFVELFLWAKAEGYRWFSLGMAPLSGLEVHELAPLWTRLGALVYRHGEHFYNFQGLRRYKEKFGPEWEPRYLACPGGLALPASLAHVAGLVSGGLSGVFTR